MPLRKLNKKVRVIAAVLALCGTVMFHYALVTGAIAGRDAAIKSGEVEAMNMARGLATQVNLSFRAADAVISELTEISEDEKIDARELHRLMGNLLKTQMALFPEIDNAMLINARGNVMQAWPSSVKASEDEEFVFFAKARERPPGELFIGAPMRSTVTQHWTIPVTRSIWRGGKFAGLAVVGVNIEYFSGLFHDMNIGREGAIVLGSMEGTMLFRRPYSPEFLGKSMLNAPIYKDYLLARDSGWTLRRSTQDGVQRLIYFNRVQRYPLFVIVALARDEILAEWKRALIWQLSITVSAAIIIALLTLYLIRVMRVRDDAEREIQEKNLSLALLNDRLKEQAMRDGMTGIANRRYLDEQLAKAIQASSRSRSPLSVIMFDVDHFKRFNDLYGHIQGDGCLQAIARQLQAMQRRYGDLAARYGGEEFALLLPDTDLNGAHVVAQKALDAIRDLRLPHSGNEAGVVTASAGVTSCIPDRNTSIEDLFSQADHALYAAKNTGRDKVCDWNSIQKKVANL